jgi:Acyl-CoA carboxylase epsilon subunit
MTGDDGAKPPAGGPALEIVAGQPSAEELAALTVALAAVLATHGDPAAPDPGGRPGRAAGWADRSRMMRYPPGPAPDAWRRSARPR